MRTNPLSIPDASTADLLTSGFHAKHLTPDSVGKADAYFPSSSRSISFLVGFAFSFVAPSLLSAGLRLSIILYLSSDLPYSIP